MLNEERQLVLQMLAEGRITVAEAEALLEALKESQAAPPPQPQAASGRGLGDLARRLFREVDQALDRAVRVVEQRVAEQEQREPYRQIRALARWLERKAEAGTEMMRRVDGCLRTNG